MKEKNPPQWLTFSERALQGIEAHSVQAGKTALCPYKAKEMRKLSPHQLWLPARAGRRQLARVAGIWGCHQHQTLVTGVPSRDASKSCCHCHSVAPAKIKALRKLPLVLE